MPEERREQREVRAADPSLTPEANRVLTDELREVTGRDAVEVPVDRPRTERGRHGGSASLKVFVSDNRIAIAMGLFVALAIGAVLGATTGSWWLVALAVAIDLVGTLVVATVVLRMTGETEHLSPTATARLEEEGVEDPDRLFSDLVEEFAPEDEEAAEHARQRDAITPSRRSRPVGP